MNFLNYLLSAATSFVLTGANAVDTPSDPSAILDNASAGHVLVRVSTPASQTGRAGKDQPTESDASPQYVASVVESLQWIGGPQTVSIDGKATFTVPHGFLFLGK